MGNNVGQVIKGLRWMPGRLGPKKGVARLRKASACCLASLAGDTRMGQPSPAKRDYLQSHLKLEGASGGTETSKYPEEKKSTEIPLVVANERGTA